MASKGDIAFVLPSLKVSGGVKEVLKLARELAQTGARVSVVSMWRSAHAVDGAGVPVRELSAWQTQLMWAGLQLPALVARFRRLMQSRRAETGAGAEPTSWIFTHFATLPLALLVRPERRWYFVQDLEWHFAGGGLVAALLRRIILSFYRRGRIVSANSYLSDALKGMGLAVEAEAPIWADARFRTAAREVRDIDVVVVLRKGRHKRLDLYLQLIDRLHQTGRAVAAITPEDHIADLVRDKVAHCWLRPDIGSMRDIFARSCLFVQLSEHEGFGLPALEAMGSGCVPYCRDSGGARAYMVDELKDLLKPLDWPVDRIANDVGRLLDDPAAMQRYSTAAREIFETGLLRAESRGTRLAGLLSSHPCSKPSA